MDEVQVETKSDWGNGTRSPRDKIQAIYDAIHLANADLEAWEEFTFRDKQEMYRISRRCENLVSRIDEELEHLAEVRGVMEDVDGTQ